MNEDTLYQHTDNEINVPVTDEETGEVVSAASFTAAQYLLGDLNNKVLVSLALDEGITVEGDNFIVRIDDSLMTENIRGRMKHQLVAWNSDGGKLIPLFQNPVFIVPVLKSSS